jgi:hypothetical protein
MGRRALGVSVLAVVLSAGFATAQNPGIGRLPPVGDLYGYSPLVQSIDPFPSRTSGYALSMFSPMGGRRIEPLPARLQRYPAVVILPVPCGSCVAAPPAQPVAAGPITAGPVVWAMPAQGLQRFAR